MWGRKRVVAGLTVVLVGGAATGAWAMTRSSGSSSTAATTTQLVAATSGTISQTVSGTGTIEPASNQSLSFPVSGTVTAVKAAVGTVVKKGAVLATLGTTDLQSAVDTATAAVTAAEEQVTSVASSSTTQQSAAAAQLASAETALTAAKTALSEATLKAPFSGTVAALSMEVGDVVGSSSSGGGGPSSGGSSTTTTTDTITLISTSKWVVNASVGSADLAQLTKGMQVQITPSGGTMVFGTVSSIGIVASSTSGTSATFPVVIAVTGSPTGLYAGASATLSFVVKQVDDVLTVPTAALHTSGTQTVVWKSVNGKRVVTPVTVGTSYGPSTQITAGLVAGDKVEVTLGGGATGTRRTGTTTGGTGGTGAPTTGGFGGGTDSGPPAGFGGATTGGAP